MIPSPLVIIHPPGSSGSPFAPPSGSLRNWRPSTAILEKPKRYEPQLRRKDITAVAQRTGLPDNFMDRVIFPDGIHHLADEEGHAAGLVLIEGVDTVMLS